MKMKGYFITHIKDVKIKGVEYRDCQVVYGVQYTTNLDYSEDYIEIPDKYKNININGMAYLPDEEEMFQTIDLIEDTESDEYYLKKINEILNETEDA